MKKVITYGTFDLFHYGHMKLLERAKNLGDYLIVGLSTDEFNLQKQKKSHHSYEHRKFILETIDLVNEVIPEKLGTKNLRYSKARYRYICHRR